MKTRLVLTLVVALAVFGAIFGYKFLTIRKAMAARAAMTVPPVTVSATEAKRETWPNTVSAVGALASFRGINVKAELEGVVRRIAFESGSAVAAGDLLVELDTSVESAQLAGLEAQARLAEITLTRARELRTNGTNAQADLDTAEAMLVQTRSAVEQLRATIAKKRIVAPFAGRLGIARIYPGQFISKGDAIVQLETLDPIHVDFSLPQQELGRISIGQQVNVSTDVLPNQALAGTITAIDPRVSETTRSVQVRATFANPEERLRPGMFARVEVVLAASENYIVLPSAAIVFNPYGDSVFVIENGVAQPRFVQPGPQRGDLTAILSGLQPGEQVVTSGQLKLRKGSAVRVDNSIAPEANPAPKPVES
ncbi:efflux RND transporter periplasmic adaptor subunit [Opitutus terrae]|uniref:Efflux transporter, RND family, MFP subunit n=1 Tax=Opitutus terrae (strain DSM 11246 / JCM 15787 / PB90-1) TaxID=452637 RepID=B1ZWU1_OPITP|nr:efflux RND transporter periplasmic adaptor subunit [Opitutus terrae]ACB74218.1 efflux transporter, RND family, MFP subunit [Opitutus terrae PB90-1]